MDVPDGVIEIELTRVDTAWLVWFNVGDTKPKECVAIPDGEIPGAVRASEDDAIAYVEARLGTASRLDQPPSDSVIAAWLVPAES